MPPFEKECVPESKPPTKITIYNLLHYDKRISNDGSMTNSGLAGAVGSGLTMYRIGVNKKI